MDENETKQLRARLRSIMVKYPQSARQMAKQMGVSHPTFMKFYNKLDTPMDIKTLYKIENWVSRRENGE